MVSGKFRLSTVVPHAYFGIFVKGLLRPGGEVFFIVLLCSFIAVLSQKNCIARKPIVTVTDEAGNPVLDALDPIPLLYDYIERDWTK